MSASVIAMLLVDAGLTKPRPEALDAKREADLAARYAQQRPLPKPGKKARRGLSASHGRLA
jgi:hypothetical protein